MALDKLKSSALDTNIDVAGTLDVTGTLTADSAGSVGGTFGIGTTSPGQTLEVNTGNDSNGIRIRRFSGSYYSDIVHTSSPEGLKFMVGSGSSVTERLRILGSGGVTFNGDTAAANALDDYEEGAFVPAYSAASSTLGATGRYTKIGRIVTIQVSISAVQSGTTFGQITGFPFAISTQNYLSIAMREFYSTGNALFTNCSVGSTSTGTLYQTPSNSTAVNGTTYGFAFSFTYHTA